MTHALFFKTKIGNSKVHVLVTHSYILELECYRVHKWYISTTLPRDLSVNEMNSMLPSSKVVMGNKTTKTWSPEESHLISEALQGFSWSILRPETINQQQGSPSRTRRELCQKLWITNLTTSNGPMV